MSVLHQLQESMCFFTMQVRPPSGSSCRSPPQRLQLSSFVLAGIVSSTVAEVPIDPVAWASSLLKLRKCTPAAYINQLEAAPPPPSPKFKMTESAGASIKGHTHTPFQEGEKKNKQQFTFYLNMLYRMYSNARTRSMSIFVRYYSFGCITGLLLGCQGW